ncbi:hypothetical protein AB0M23_00840 [Streptomyces sp. NPDC052077]|uniref:hypothetical protein n=1 Tax=Streptomyces sp. NPDC052077 TaxID=3154757 RepID=UPI0034409044
MADEQDRWLDRETAEILLRGESPDTEDPVLRERVGKLADALGALSAPPPPTGGNDGELAGEAAALAAFRTARADREEAPGRAPAGLGRGKGALPSDAGLVRLGGAGGLFRRPSWGRPLRFGLAAALAVGMVGGVAVAAGTGVLPAPFGGPRPDSASTVSAAETPRRPAPSPEPLDGTRGGAGPVVPGETPDGVKGEPAGEDDPDGTGRTPGAGDRRQRLLAACRDRGTGRKLDNARSRVLAEAAGGASRVAVYCRDLLSAGSGVVNGDGRVRPGNGNGNGKDASPRPRGRETGKNPGSQGSQGNGQGNQGNGQGNQGNGQGDQGNGQGNQGQGQGSQGGQGNQGNGGGNQANKGGQGSQGEQDDDGDGAAVRPGATASGPPAKAPAGRPPHAPSGRPADPDGAGTGTVPAPGSLRPGSAATTGPVRRTVPAGDGAPAAGVTLSGPPAQ